MESTLPHRRRLSLSLRVAMLLVLVVGIGMSRPVRKAYEQRVAVEAIRRYGGWVSYDWERTALQSGTQTEGPHAPQWLRRCLGDEYFQKVVYVNLDYDENSDDQVENRNVRPCDDLLEKIGNLTGTETLILKQGQVTDEGMRSIGRLTNLERLWLRNAHAISDVGVAHLKDLKKLRNFCLTYTRITDASLERLSHLRELAFLSLDGNGITDAGLAHLSVLTELQHLSVGGGESNITDAGISRLKLDYKRYFRSLHFHETSVTDRGLESLRGLRLDWLGASGSKVTDAGLAKLRNLVPELHIID